MSATVNLTVTLDFDDDTEARAYAAAHAPLLAHWRDYPQVMRDAWRARMGFGWRSQLALPPAIDGLPFTPDAVPASPPEDGADWRPPARDNPGSRPVPPPPKLPPAPALVARPVPKPAPKRAGFLAAASQLAAKP